MSFRDNLSNDKVKHRHPRVFTSTSKKEITHSLNLVLKMLMIWNQLQSSDSSSSKPGAKRHWPLRVLQMVATRDGNQEFPISEFEHNNRNIQAPIWNGPLTENNTTYLKFTSFYHFRKQHQKWTLSLVSHYWRAAILKTVHDIVATWFWYSWVLEMRVVSSVSRNTFTDPGT